MIRSLLPMASLAILVILCFAAMFITMSQTPTAVEQPPAGIAANAPKTNQTPAVETPTPPPADVGATVEQPPAPTPAAANAPDNQTPAVETPTPPPADVGATPPPAPPAEAKPKTIPIPKRIEQARKALAETIEQFRKEADALDIGG